jgi:hypothetical protein
MRAGPISLAEAEARAVNAEPWEPLPGMVKRQCPACSYFFAARPNRDEPRCPDCTSRRPRRRARPADWPAYAP